MKIKNLYLWLKDQFKRKTWFRNFFITGNAWGGFSKYSHISRSTGNPKISYSTPEKALKAAEKMSKKHGVHFSIYKCIWCDGWHIGKNRDNKYEKIS